MTGVGPELARQLGGTWDAAAKRVQLRHHIIIAMRPTGAVWLINSGGVERRIGSLSDGADVLAARARELGAWE